MICIIRLSHQDRTSCQLNTDIFVDCNRNTEAQLTAAKLKTSCSAVHDNLAPVVLFIFDSNM